MELKQFQTILESKIPMTKSMGFQLQTLNGAEAVATSPLELNRNHRGSAFGGSLYNALVLTSYSWLYGNLSDANAGISLLIAEANIKYLKEVEGDILCVCKSPSEASLSKFYKGFESKGRARIDLEASVVSSDRSVVFATLSGRFVAIKGSS